MGNASGRDQLPDDDQSQLRSANGDDLPQSLHPEPTSPTRSPSPHLFTPQHPVASMPREDAMFNHTGRGEPLASDVVDSPTEKLIPTLITWSHGGDNVAVEGSWDSWESRTVLQRAGKDHSLFLVLPSGVFHYRFIVDGETRRSPDLPFVTDEMGNVCHLLDVHDYVPESLDGVSQFEAPGSPESSYDQDFPEEDDFSREPVVVPSQLHRSVLDVPNAEDTSSKPQHVVLNHLYMEKGWASESVVGLGVTHRFESKYVTVVLYKPLKR